MRDILFRGKRCDNGKWVEGSLYLYGEDVWIDAEYDFPSTDPWVKVDPTTIGQYTGLTAKGKRIFEGDIVRLEFVDAEEIGEIFWSEEWCKIAFLSPDGSAYGIDGTTEIQVIGNIHDNPELLKGE